MPIPVKIHNNSSPPVKVKPLDDSCSVRVKSGTATIADKRLENLIDEERKERISEDERLQSQIDDIVANEGARAIQIDSINNGSIDISLLDENDNIISTDTLTYDMLRPYMGDLEPSSVYQGKVWLDSDEINEEEPITTRTLRTLFTNHAQEFIVEQTNPNSDEHIVESIQQSQNNDDYYDIDLDEDEYVVETAQQLTQEFIVEDIDIVNENEIVEESTDSEEFIVYEPRNEFEYIAE